MTSEYNLFLDDVRDPKNVTWVKLPECNWIVVRNYESFKETILHHGIPKFIAYDHDLADSHYGDGLKNRVIDYNKYREKTGYDAARYLVNECMTKGVKHPQYVVHSMNPVGKANIINYVESYNKSY